MVAQYQNQLHQQQNQQNTPLFPRDFPSLEKDDIYNLKAASFNAPLNKKKLNEKEISLAEVVVESSKTTKSTSTVKRRKIIPNKLNLAQCLMRQSSITSPFDNVVSSKTNSKSKFVLSFQFFCLCFKLC